MVSTTPYARCYDCTWETYGHHAYRDAQLHLEDHPHHHAYTTTTGGHPKP